MMLERESHSQVLGPPSTDRGESLTSHSTSHHHASGHYKLGSSYRLRIGSTSAQWVLDVTSPSADTRVLIGRVGLIGE